MDTTFKLMILDVLNVYVIGYLHYVLCNISKYNFYCTPLHSNAPCYKPISLLNK